MGYLGPRVTKQQSIKPPQQDISFFFKANLLVKLILYSVADGEIKQEQIEVPEGNILDEGHDEAGQKETA